MRQSYELQLPAAAGRQVHQRPARAPANAETGAGGG